MEISPMKTFEELTKSENYQKLVEQLSEKERKEIEESLKQYLDMFDMAVLNVLDSVQK